MAFWRDMRETMTPHSTAPHKPNQAYIFVVNQVNPNIRASHERILMVDDP